MNRAELIKVISEKTGETQKAVKQVIVALSEEIALQLKSGNEVILYEVGSFKPANRAARVRRNPSTGARVDCPAYIAATFKPGKVLKDFLNQ